MNVFIITLVAVCSGVVCYRAGYMHGWRNGDRNATDAYRRGYESLNRKNKRQPS